MRHSLIVASFFLALVLAMLGGCQGLPKNVADCPTTPTTPFEYPADTYYTAQPHWYQEEIDTAFQMGGNYAQQPYSVWLDEVNLLAN